jgi:hypothetical protein
VGTYGPCYQQLARAPAVPEASAPSSVELDAVADQAISAYSGDARTTVKGLIAAKDFLVGQVGRARAAVSKGSRSASAVPRDQGCAARKDLPFYFLFFQISP